MSTKDEEGLQTALVTGQKALGGGGGREECHRVRSSAGGKMAIRKVAGDEEVIRKAREWRMVRDARPDQ